MIATVKQVDAVSCPLCGKPDSYATYSGEVGQRMKITSECFNCAFWEIRADEGCPTVIDHCVYTPGTRTTGDYRGMAGRRFDIRYFDGREIATVDLWSGGVIPERWRERLPNTAEFINGAKRCDAGGTVCWNESSNKPVGSLSGKLNAR